MSWRGKAGKRHPQGVIGPPWCKIEPGLEGSMRAAGKLVLTGAAVIVLWKLMAAIFVGILGMALKVGLVLLAVYILLQVLNGRKKEE